MDLRQKLAQARKWISENTDERKFMMGVTLIFGILGAFGNPIFLALALLPVYRTGWLEGNGEVMCDECGKSLEEPFEGTAYTRNHVRLTD